MFIDNTILSHIKDKEYMIQNVRMERYTGQKIHIKTSVEDKNYLVLMYLEPNEYYKNNQKNNQNSNNMNLDNEILIYYYSALYNEYNCLANIIPENNTKKNIIKIKNILKNYHDFFPELKTLF